MLQLCTCVKARYERNVRLLSNSYTSKYDTSKYIVKKVFSSILCPVCQANARKLKYLPNLISFSKKSSVARDAPTRNSYRIEELRIQLTITNNNILGRRHALRLWTRRRIVSHFERDCQIQKLSSFFCDGRPLREEHMNIVFHLPLVNFHHY